MTELNINFWTIAPQIILSVFAFMLMLIGSATRTKNAGNLQLISALGLLLAGLANIYTMKIRKLGFSNMIMTDDLTGYFNILFYIIGFIVCLISEGYIDGRIKHKGEYYALILFSVTGMTFISSSLDFIMLFLGLEIMSFSVYILAGMFKNDIKSTESAIKYFLLGSFSTAIFLLGVALLYGAFGTTNFAYMLQTFAKFYESEKTVNLIAGSALVLTGIIFKIAVVPFHMWTPDVYEGAPTSVTAFMATAVKASAFLMLIKVYLIGLRPLVFDVAGVIAILSIITMTLGNLSALTQKNVKRMLAYSSIAHAGYILLGFVALNQISLSAILYYLFSYAFMNIGAFAICSLFEKEGIGCELSDLSGKGFKHPFLGLMAVIFMFSMAGIPPTAGFVGKFYIFTGVIQSGYLSLAIIGVLNSAISAYYYLRVLVYMFFKEYEGGVSPTTVTPSTAVGIIISGMGVLFLGTLPAFLFNGISKAFTFLF